MVTGVGMVATPEGNGRVLKEPSEEMEIFSIFFWVVVNECTPM